MRTITGVLVAAGTLLIVWGLIKGLLYTPPYPYGDTGQYPMELLLPELARPFELLLAGVGLMAAALVTERLSRH
ncbi:hypothetical protein ACIBIZ_37050 [Nonomuraea spiralis]|uniref:hypothetical protein n=1 Tax=Nonomuraea spiralis TaxID=46182 RepID=UPI0037B3BB3C